MRRNRIGWYAAICAALLTGCSLDFKDDYDLPDDDEEGFSGVNVFNCRDTESVGVFRTTNLGQWGEVLFVIPAGGSDCTQSYYVAFEDSPKYWVRTIMDFDGCAEGSFEAEDCSPFQGTKAFDHNVRGDVYTWEVN